MALVPIVPFAVMAWCFEPAATRWQWTHASFGAWAGVAYLGWFATVAAYAMWTWLLKRHAANRVAPFSLGVPVVGLAVVMFGGRWRRGLTTRARNSLAVFARIGPQAVDVDDADAAVGDADQPGILELVQGAVRMLT